MTFQTDHTTIFEAMQGRARDLTERGIRFFVYADFAILPVMAASRLIRRSTFNNYSSIAVKRGNWRVVDKGKFTLVGTGEKDSGKGSPLTNIHVQPRLPNVTITDAELDRRGNEGRLALLQGLMLLDAHPFFVHNIALSFHTQTLLCYNSLQMGERRLKGVYVRTQEMRKRTRKAYIALDPTVHALFHPNGGVQVYVSCSTKPFRLKTGRDVDLLCDYFRHLDEVIRELVGTEAALTIPTFLSWWSDRLEVNKDVRRIASWRTIYLRCLTIKQLHRVFRIYLKRMQGADYYRVECTVNDKQRLEHAFEHVFQKLLQEKERKVS